MATREDLHLLVDALPEERLAWAAIDLAPYDDEPVSDEDRAAIAEARPHGARATPCPSPRRWPSWSRPTGIAASRVELTRRARRDLARLDPPVCARIAGAIEALPNGDVAMLRGGSPRSYRLRWAIGG